MAKKNTSNFGNIELKGYERSNNLAVPKGKVIRVEGGPNLMEALINKGEAYNSMVNKLHLIKLVNIPAMDTGYANNPKFEPKTAYDLCAMGGDSEGSVQYDIDDFIYCKNFGQPINKLITLRRFPYPCTDNIYDSTNQAEPDIARMVTYITQDINKLEDLLAFSYGLKWKELTAEMEQASTIGDQSGFEGLSKTIMSFIDPVMSGNTLRGKNALDYDPKHDQNKAYGPVDSITSTHIRETGFDFTKEFDLVFEYDLQSWGGRTPEFAMKDIIANILATTYNNGKFWPGSRYWVGERPSQFLNKFKFMNPSSVDEFFKDGIDALRGAAKSFGSKESAINQLKNVLKNGMAMALGKLLDTVGRPSIIVMNSLLSGEPVGNWHVTIGNPDNPIMCIGNLICTGVDVKFPSDSLSFGDFPTKLVVNVKLKPAMPKDKAGIEMMFNQGKQRIYYNPKSVTVNKNKSTISKQARGFYGFDKADISRTIEQTFDFVAENAVDIVFSDTDSNQNIHDNSKNDVPVLLQSTKNKSDTIKNNSAFV